MIKGNKIKIKVKKMLKKIVSFLNQDITTLTQNNSQKEDISENSINIHNQAISEAKILASIAKTIDNPNFQQSDFKFYLQIKSLFARNKESYQGLETSAELLRLAVKAQGNFLKIEQTELRYRSTKQQEYYEFVLNFLGEKFGDDDDNNDLENNQIVAKKRQENKYSPEEFKQQIRTKLEEIKPTIKTEQGREALEDYTESLEGLAEEKDIGLKLLYLFKKFNLTDFSVLRVISDMVLYLQDKNMQNMKAMQDLVIKNEDVFIKLGRIIGVPKTKETPDTYAKLLQYLALSKKHEQTREQFIKLIQVLKPWQGFYRTITDIREQYSANQYNLPEEFTQEIPGLSIYENYQQYINIF